MGSSHALELAIGQSWHGHSDIDVDITRDELHLVRPFLADCDLHVAADGRLSRWDGRALTAERHENNIWVRRDAGSAWQLDLVVGAGTSTEWQSRKDPTIGAQWDDAVRHCGTVPYPAPHVEGTAQGPCQAVGV